MNNKINNKEEVKFSYVLNKMANKYENIEKLYKISKLIYLCLFSKIIYKKIKSLDNEINKK